MNQVNRSNTDDIYELFDYQDKFIERGNRALAAKNELFTRSVHILVIDLSGKILVCKRPSNKSSYANKLTSSAGGHVEDGETYEEAAQRELEEELGISPKLIDYGRFDLVNDVERTIHRLFVCYPSHSELSQITFDPLEVSEHSYKTISEVNSLLIDKLNDLADPFVQAVKCLDNKRQIILDFDHTLFDWYRFKIDLASKIKSDLDIVIPLFTAAKDKVELNGLYNIYDHLKKLASMSGCSYQQLANILESLLVSANGYLFADARTFLKTTYRQKSNMVTIVTFGDPENQSLFIDRSIAKSYINNIVYVTSKDDKPVWFERISNLSTKAPYVINDDPHEATHKSLNLAPHTHHFLVERAGAKYPSIDTHSNYQIVKKLTEIVIPKNI